MKFKEYLLKDIATITMGQSPKSQFYNEDGKGIEFLQGVRTFGEDFPYFDTYTTKYNRLAHKNSILFSVRAPVGRVNWATKNIAIGRGVASISVKDMVYDRYVYYYFKKMGSFYDKKATGTVFTSINKKELESLKIKISANYDDQKRIADRLAILDSKIHLNQQINANLDKLMSEIFDHYIVESKTFNTDSLTNIANYKNGLAMQNFRPQGKDEGIPVLKIKELNQGITDSSSDRCSSEIPNDVIVNTGDVIFSWSGTLLVKLWTGKKCGLNQHLFKVTSDKYPKWFIYKWTEYYLRRFQSIAAGKATTMGHIKRSDLKQAKVKVPSKEELIKLNQCISPLFHKYINNIYEVSELQEIKNTLLNKLF